MSLLPIMYTIKMTRRRKAVTLLVQEGPDWKIAQACWFQVVLRVVWKKIEASQVEDQTGKVTVTIEEGAVDGGVQSKRATGTSPMHLDLRLHPHPPSIGEGPGKGYFKEQFKWMIAELAWSCHPEDGRDLEQGGQPHEQIPLHHCAPPFRSLQ